MAVATRPPAFLSTTFKAVATQLLARPADALLRDNGIMGPMTGSVVGSGYPNPLVTQKEAGNLDPFKTQGATGTVFFSGLLTDLQEYNPDCQGDAWYDVADRMFRSSAAVRAVTACIMLPLLRATWSVRPPADPNDIEVEAAQLVQDQLFSGQSVTWRSELTQILLGLLKYGFWMGEKLWARGDDGYGAKLDRIAPRLARTMYRWYVDPETDDLDRVQQRVWVPDPDGVTGSWKYPMLYMKKHIRFAYQQEGNYFKGLALYRHMYSDWYYQDVLAKLDAIVYEKNGLGIPWFDAPEGAQESDKTLARRILESLHVHEQQYGISPAGWQFDFKSSQGGKDALPSIEMHQRNIFLTGLATFATDQGGSYAKSQDLSAFFTEAEYALAEELGETMDRHVVREIVDFNYKDYLAGGNRYPTIHVTGIDRRQVGTWLRSMAQLFVAGAITRDDAVENVIRDWFDFPDLPTSPFGPPEHQPTVDTGSGGTPATEQTQAEGLEGTQEPGANVDRSTPRPAPASAAGAAGGGDYSEESDRQPWLDERLSDAAAVSLWKLRYRAAPRELLETVDAMLSEEPDGLEHGEWSRMVLDQAARAAA